MHGEADDRQRSPDNCKRDKEGRQEDQDREKRKVERGEDATMEEAPQDMATEQDIDAPQNGEAAPEDD